METGDAQVGGGPCAVAGDYGMETDNARVGELHCVFFGVVVGLGVSGAGADTRGRGRLEKRRRRRYK